MVPLRCSNKVFLLIVFVLFASSMPCHSDGSALGTEFTSLYKTLKNAIADQNKDGVAALLDSDFVSIEISDARKNADQMIAEIAAVPKYLKKDSLTTVLNVDILGEIAHVTQRYHMTASKSGSDGEIHNVEVTALSSDEWERHGDKWLLQKSRTDSIDMLMDGKLVVHKTRPET
jgi:hypothetical protein